MVGRLAWVLAIALGCAVGGFLLHFPGSYGEPAWSVGAGIFGLILGAVNGLGVGLLAWAALGFPRGMGGRVIGTLALVVGVTHGLNDGSSTVVPFVVMESIAGLLVAAIVARRWEVRTPASVAIVGAAWAAGLVLGGWSGNIIGLPWTETPIGWSLDHAWDGLVGGLVFGIATAAIGIPDALRGPRWGAGITASAEPAGTA